MGDNPPLLGPDPGSGDPLAPERRPSETGATMDAEGRELSPTPILSSLSGILAACAALVPTLPSLFEWICAVGAVFCAWWPSVRRAPAFEPRGGPPPLTAVLALPWILVLAGGLLSLISHGRWSTGIPPLVQLSAGLTWALALSFAPTRPLLGRGFLLGTLGAGTCLAGGVLGSAALGIVIDGRTAFGVSNAGFDARALCFALWVGLSLAAPSPASVQPSPGARGALAGPVFVATLWGLALGWTAARGAWIAAGAGGLCWFAAARWFRRKRPEPPPEAGLQTGTLHPGFGRPLHWALPALVAAILAGATQVEQHSSLHSPWRGLGSGDPYALTSGRTAIWARGLEMAKDHLPLGIGPGRFPEMYDRYHQAALTRGARPTRPGRQPDSLYLMVLTEYGMVVVAVLAQLLWLVHALRRDPAGLGGLVMFAVAALSQDALTDRLSWLALATFWTRALAARRGDGRSIEGAATRTAIRSG